MFVRNHTDKLLIPIAALILLVVISYRPKYHLQSEMPSGFFHQEQKSSKPSLDQKIAWAYWENAQMNIQWRYVYGHPLPVDPPPEFQVDAKALGPAASDPGTRMMYWHRLEQVWPLPETWAKDYEWDFGWLGDPAVSGAQWIKGEFERLFSGH